MRSASAKELRKQRENIWKRYFVWMKMPVQPSFYMSCWMKRTHNQMWEMFHSHKNARNRFISSVGIVYIQWIRRVEQRRGDRDVGCIYCIEFLVHTYTMLNQRPVSLLVMRNACLSYTIHTIHSTGMVDCQHISVCGFLCDRAYALHASYLFWAKQTPCVCVNSSTQVQTSLTWH